MIVITWQTRSTANEYQDSLPMCASSIVVGLFGTIMVALDFSVNSEPDSALLIRGMGVQISVILLSVLHYGLKFINTYLNEAAIGVSESGSAVIHSAVGTTSSMSASTLQYSTLRGINQKNAMTTTFRDHNTKLK